MKTEIIETWIEELNREMRREEHIPRMRILHDRIHFLQKIVTNRTISRLREKYAKTP